MRVKLRSRCPYTPRDLTGHFDPEGELSSAQNATANKRRAPATARASPTGGNDA
jgi:hypothetical protein